MNEVKHLYYQNPKASVLILKNRNIRDGDHQLFNEILKFKDLIELDLSDNNITRIPDNVSELQKLRKLDLTNNPLENLEQISYALSGLPNLMELKLNLKTQDEALVVLSNLQSLQYLNGKSTKDEESHFIDIEDSAIENISLNKEIANFNGIFTKISEKLKLINKDFQKNFIDEFQVLLGTEIEKINHCVDASAPNYLYGVNVLHSKIKIFRYFNLKYAEYFDRRDNESKKIFNEIQMNLNNSTEGVMEIVLNLHEKISEKGNNIKSEMENALRNAEQVDGNVNRYQDQVRLLEEQRAVLEKQLHDDRQRIDKLENENRIMTDNLLKRAKSIKNMPKSHHVQHDSHNTSPTRKHEEHKVQQPISGGELVKSKSGNNIVINPTMPRTMTKKMMKDIIDDIYHGKVNYDKSCEENHLPYETMEQYMYSYFNNKYGLKNLVIEWATSVINGIKLYNSEDSDICLFGKILRNEIEEESRVVLQRLKVTISDLLMFFIKSKYPMKNNGDLKEICKQRMESFIMEEEWKGIVYYVYENEDAKFLESKIIDFISKKYFDKKVVDCNRKLTREELISISKMKEDYKILYADFQKILADFQIKTRENYLKNFVFIFKRIDNNNDGVIDEDQFIELISKVSYYNNNLEEEATRLLGIIDPYNNKRFTFSECISLFSLEYLIEEDETGNQRKLTILDKICMDENFV